VEAAAYGAYRVAVASMVRAVRAVSAERGHDPREAALVAFGGNGPLHGAAVAAELGVPRVLVPPAPGVFSAYGLLAAEVEHHFLRTSLGLLDALDDGERQGFTALLREMAAGARQTLAHDGYGADRTALRWSADLRYLGQSFELAIPFTPADNLTFDEKTAAALVEAFGAGHERTYGHRAAGEPVELVNVRLAARGLAAQPRRLPGPPAPAAQRTVAGGRSRRAYFGPPAGWIETPVVARSGLDPRPAAGPLIVEEYDATTLVPPGWTARPGPAGTIMLERAS
jgi:N-methylhydantoinase A